MTISTQQQIIDQEAKLLAAIQANDLDILDTLLHENLLFNLPDGQTITKAMDMAVYRSGQITMHDLVATDQLVHVLDPTTAVVAVSIRLKGLYQQQPIDGTFRYIRVWVFMGQRWKVIAGSSTQIAHSHSLG